MYMANARILHLGPNATYIPLTCVWVSRWVTQCFCVFRYQHVGIGNAKSSRWGCNPTQGPNASGFASQWNIGFRFARFTELLNREELRNHYVCVPFGSRYPRVALLSVYLFYYPTIYVLEMKYCSGFDKKGV